MAATKLPTMRLARTPMWHLRERSLLPSAPSRQGFFTPQVEGETDDFWGRAGHVPRLDHAAREGSLEAARSYRWTSFVRGGHADRGAQGYSRAQNRQPKR